MVLASLRERKKQKYLILVLVLVVLLTLSVLWLGYKPKKTPPITLESFRPKELKINFEVLRSPVLKELQFFEETPPLEKEVGRENPFIPY